MSQSFVLLRRASRVVGLSVALHALGCSDEPVSAPPLALSPAGAAGAAAAGAGPAGSAGAGGNTSSGNTSGGMASAGSGGSSTPAGACTPEMAPGCDAPLDPDAPPDDPATSAEADASTAG